MKPLPLKEREYREGLYTLERRAIIPLKWCILGITLLLWLWATGGAPARPVVLLFLGYLASNLTLTYLFCFSVVSTTQIRPLTLVSYLLDVIFVTMLIYFDLTTTYFGTQTHNNFYILYFLLVMRGFALFKTIGETIFVNLLISALFILMNYLQRSAINFLLDPDFTQSMVLIWLVILMSWFVIMIINRQKIELIEMHDQLMRSESLARVGELAAGVAHEVNNPIGIIATTAAYLKKYKPDDPAEWEEEIDTIEREAMRVKEVVQEMLTYANPRPAGRTAVSLTALNDEVLDFVFPRKRSEHCEVIRLYDSHANLVRVDANLFKQALLNIYMNAKQAIPPESHGRITARVESQGRKIHMEIEDNGSGIAEDDLDQIFNPFFTRKTSGTGLGLSITQRIIETFGGAIWAECPRSGGARFCIELPIATGSGIESA